MGNRILKNKIILEQFECLYEEAHLLNKALTSKKKKLVLAESCTGGLCSATLASVPGASKYLCGSFVTYQSESKTQWINVSSKLLKTHGAVSAEVASAMASGSLSQTSNAKISGAITGHLGPKAPKKLDGVFYIACGLLLPNTRKTEIFVVRHQIPAAKSLSVLDQRLYRQLIASQSLLMMVRSLLIEHY